MTREPELDDRSRYIGLKINQYFARNRRCPQLLIDTLDMTDSEKEALLGFLGDFPKLSEFGDSDREAIKGLARGIAEEKAILKLIEEERFSWDASNL